LPLEASNYFASRLYPIVYKMVENKFDDPIVSRSIITEDKKLKPEHEHLYKSLSNIKSESDRISVISNSQRKVLLAGSGLVTKPLVKYLLSQKNIDISIASNNIDEAQKLASGFQNTKVVELDVSNGTQVDSLVSAHDIVISMLPATLHMSLANSAIKNRKNMVTASYISKDMESLNQSAQNSGITILNEMGLDPGIDHCSAMKIIDEIKGRGGKIRSFVSWCGGLPAPEDSNNSLGYKFSWSPRGVLTAGMNSAKYMLNGKTVEIDGSKLLSNSFKNVPLFKGFNFEGLANRDSLSYIDVYGLNRQELSTMFRGTLRYRGYAELMESFKTLGLLDSSRISFKGTNTELFELKNCEEFCKHALNIPSADLDVVQDKVSSALKLEKTHSRVRDVLDAFRSFGMIRSNNILSQNAQKVISPTILDGFCSILQRNMAYGLYEKDMVALYHEITAEFEPGNYELHKSSLVTYGSINTDGTVNETAMARTVGIPAAIGAKIILDGLVKTKGVIRPTLKEVYKPTLLNIERLAPEDSIIFNETCTKVGIDELKARSIAFRL
ncbi:hypothetical protein BB560_002241, partial [Smittium megazygosporum]